MIYYVLIWRTASGFLKSMFGSNTHEAASIWTFLILRNIYTSKALVGVQVQWATLT